MAKLTAQARAAGSEKAMQAAMQDVFQALGALQDALAAFRRAADYQEAAEPTAGAALWAAAVRYRARVVLSEAAAKVAEAAVELSETADDAVAAADQALAEVLVRALGTAAARQDAGFLAVARGLRAHPVLGAAFSAFVSVPAESDAAARVSEPAAEPDDRRD